MAIVLFVLLAAAVRLPGISRPLLGQFATKNAIYAMIARNWASGRAPFWLPTVDCMAGGQRSWHLLELPLAAYLAGEGWALSGGSLDAWGRAVSVAFSLGAVVLLYLLVRRWHGDRAAYVAALVFALSPISILCGQSFMLEASAVFFMLLTLWSVENWLALCQSCIDECNRDGWGKAATQSEFGIEGLRRRCPAEEVISGASLAARADRNGPSMSASFCPSHLCQIPQWTIGRGLAVSSWHWWILATVSVALMLCTKIYLAVMLMPLTIMAMCAARSADTRRRRLIFSGWGAMMILGAAPAIIWCSAVTSMASPDNPLSSHIYYSLSRSAAVNSISSRLLFNTDFYVHLLRSLAGAGLTPIGLGLALIGLCDRGSRRHAAWLAALALLVILLPGKFFELRYYILILVPALSVLAGLGWNLFSGRLRFPRLGAVSCLVSGLGCSLWLVAGPAWTTPREDRSVVAAAEAVREIAPAGQPVATLHGAAPDLLYYCDRPGWALSVNDRHFPETLDRCRQSGAHFLVVSNLALLDGKPAAAVVSRLSIERAGDDYCIYRLAALGKTRNNGPRSEPEGFLISGGWGRAATRDRFGWNAPPRRCPGGATPGHRWPTKPLW